MGDNDIRWSLTRARILRAIKDNEGKEGIPIHKLVKITKIPRSTLLFNLNQLEERKLIKSEQRKELGSPIYLTTNKAHPLLNSTLEFLSKIYPDKNIK